MNRAPPARIWFRIPQEKAVIQFSGRQQLQLGIKTVSVLVFRAREFRVRASEALPGFEKLALRRSTGCCPKPIPLTENNF